MRTLKRISIMSLATIILTLNIATFALKPMQVQAVAIIGATEIGSLIWGLLITAGVAIGVYDTADRIEKQQAIYDEYVKSITLDDINNLNIVGYNHSVDGTSALIEDVKKFNVIESGGQKPDPEDPDKPPVITPEDAWKAMPKFDFKVNGTFIAKIGQFFSDLWADNTSEVHTSVFGVSSDYEHNWNGSYHIIGSNYIYDEIRYTINLGVGEDYFYPTIPTTNTFSIFLSSNKPVVGILNKEKTLIRLSDLHGSILNPFNWTSIYLYKYNANKLDDPALKVYTLSSSGYSINSKNFNGKIPLFYNEESALAFLKGQTVSDSEYANKAEKKPFIPNYPLAISELALRLNPLILPEKPISTDVLPQTVEGLQIAIKPQLDNALENDKPLDKPTYDKIFDDALTDAAKNPRPNPEPDPEPNPKPDPKPDVEQGNPDDLLADLKSVFPFCIPFDLIHAFTVLQADAEAPYWEIPFKAPLFHIDYTFVIDFNKFNSVAQVFRTCETIGFIIGLILVTRKLIKG